MKRAVPYLCLAALLSLASLALAGGDHHCDTDVQACLNARAAKLASHGWLGIETEKNEARHAYAVTTVVPGSPAEKAGFRQGDILVALGGVRIAEGNHEALKKVKSTLGVGKQATYTVERDGRELRLTATLAPVPREVLARWVGEHMLEHHVTTEIAQKN